MSQTPPTAPSDSELRAYAYEMLGELSHMLKEAGDDQIALILEAIVEGGRTSRDPCQDNIPRVST